MFNFTGMKKKKMSCLGAFFLMAVVMFTSCLGEGSNVMERPIVGVVTTHPQTFQKVLDVGGVYFSAVDFLDKSDGACWWVHYRLDNDLPENANAGQTGIYTVAILNKYEYERHDVASQLTDSSVLLEKELPLMNPVYNFQGYIQGRIFLDHALNQPKGQQNNWDLSYDYQKMYEEESGERVYELYIRATVKSESTNSAENQLIPCAYYARSFFEAAAREEKSDNKSDVYFRLNYVSEIREDGEMTWKKTEKLYLPVNIILTENLIID